MTLKFFWSNGREYLIDNSFKFRETRQLNNDLIAWRCCAKDCPSSLKTNKERTEITQRNGLHKHKAPILNKSMESPVADTSQTHSTIAVSTPVAHHLPSPPSQPTCHEVELNHKPEDNELVIKLKEREDEVIELKNKLSKMNDEIKVLVDHSVDSDQKLLQFTDKIFTSPLHNSRLQCVSTQTDLNTFNIEHVQGTLERTIDAYDTLKLQYNNVLTALNTIEEKNLILEQKNTSLHTPCYTCSVLKEESEKMIGSMRILETDNEQLKLCLQTACSAVQPSPSPEKIDDSCERCLVFQEDNKQLMHKIESLHDEQLRQRKYIQELSYGNARDLTSLLNYHKNYPRDSFRCLAERLRTEASMYQRDLKEAKKKNGNLIQKIKQLETSLEHINISPSNSTLMTLPLSSPLPLSNNFDILSEEVNCSAEFVEVQKRRRRKEKRHSSDPKTGSNKQHTYKNIPTFTRRKHLKNNLKTPFNKITVVGDSHARGIAGLLLKETESHTTITGVCKPNAQLIDILPPPPDSEGDPTTSLVEDREEPPTLLRDCVVVLAGSNDVDRGNYSNIYRHMEAAISHCASSASVLVATLPIRHDYPPQHSINNTILCVNSYIEELCNRISGAEVLDVNTIGRRHFTSHGMHLKPSGKLLLAQLVTEKLKRMTPRIRSSPQPAPRQNKGTTNAASNCNPSPRPQPRTLPHNTFADAVKHNEPSSPSSHHKQIDEINNTLTNSVFLVDPLLAKGPN